MPRIIKLFFACIICTGNIAAQYSFEQKVETVKTLLKTVETGKLTYQQNLKLTTEGQLIFSLNAVDKKGKEVETIHNFSFADIDENTVRSITKKDVILVLLLVSEKQKLIQLVSNNRDKISYQNALSFYAENADNARDLEKAIKALIPEAVALDDNRLSLRSYEDHIQWLTNNIFDIELPKKQIVQKSAADGIIGHFSLDQTFNAKSKSSNQLNILNLATLNPNSIGYRISADEFTVQASTRRNIKGIKYSKDGVQKNYMDKIEIYANSIINGKDLYKVLKAIVPLAEEQFNKVKPKVVSLEEATNFLNKAIAEVGTGDGSLSQNLSHNKNVVTYKLTETKPDTSLDYEYNFNFADINSNALDFDGQKDRLFVELPIKKSVKFIRNSKNGEIQNYNNSCKIYFNTIEDALIGVEALKNLVVLFEKKLEDSKYQYTSVNASVADLKKEIGKVQIGEDAYDSFLELSDEKTNTLKLTTVFSNLKKSVETVQEFSANDINEKNITVKVSGKRVWAELNTKHLEKIVKTYVDGQIKPYQHKVTIEAKDVENARRMVQIFTALAENK